MGDQRPLILQIFEFPLVAMAAGILLFAFATELGLYFDGFVPQVGQPATDVLLMIVNIMPLLVVYKLAIAQLGERPHDDLLSKGAWRNLGLGLLAGTLLYTAVVATAAGLGVFRIAGAGETSTLVRQVMDHGITPGITEELLFRGIIFRWFEEFAGSGLALAVTSLLFGLAHILNPNATLFSSFAIAVESLVLGGAYMLTRSLWAPIGLHAAWNVTQGSIFGIAVSGEAAHGLVKSQLSGPAILSGGDFGLEASIVAIVIAGVAGMGSIAIAAKRGKFIQPSWIRSRQSF